MMQSNLNGLHSDKGFIRNNQFFDCGTSQTTKKKPMGSYIKYSHKQRWGPRGRPWPRGRPRGHILKSLALASKVKSLASKPQVLENCPVLGSRTALFLESLKYCWKTPKTSRIIYEHLFCFSQLEHRRSQEGD